MSAQIVCPSKDLAGNCLLTSHYQYFKGSEQFITNKQFISLFIYLFVYILIFLIYLFFIGLIKCLKLFGKHHFGFLFCSKFAGMLTSSCIFINHIVTCFLLDIWLGAVYASLWASFWWWKAAICFDRWSKWTRETCTRRL